MPGLVPSSESLMMPFSSQLFLSALHLHTDGPTPPGAVVSGCEYSVFSQLDLHGVRRRASSSPTPVSTRSQITQHPYSAPPRLGTGQTAASPLDPTPLPADFTSLGGSTV